MIISVDISYYPLKDSYLAPISQFIENLNTYPEILVRTNPMSTQLIGPYSSVFNALQTEIKRSFENPDSVFVLKIVNMDLTEIPK